MAISAGPLINAFGFAGLAIAVLVGELLESLLLLFLLRAHLGGHLFVELARPIGAVVSASLVALAVAALTAAVMSALVSRETLLLRAIADGTASAVGLFVYVLMSARFDLAAAQAPIGALRSAIAMLFARVRPQP
jgi:peptidoglycan biosynthesis protein MviN/MurJ (putative lipid II flippase)